MIVNMIKRAYQEEDPEDIEQYVTLHYGELIKEIFILFGFGTREEINKLQIEAVKKAVSQ